jgi:ATP-binding cassette subfamily F protein uup
MQNPAFYRQEPAAICAANEELAAAQAELNAAYERWEALEALR